MTQAVPLVDLALSRRLERAEAHANRRFVGSPLTQTFGLGVFEPVTPAVLETLETFVTSRGSDTVHEARPLAEPSALALRAGASAVPGARGQGALRHAERSGFRIASRRITWHRAR